MLFEPDIESSKQYDSNHIKAQVSFLIQINQTKTVQKCKGSRNNTEVHADTNTEMDPEI